jgi:thiamine biosynthesis protein ThiS
VSTENEVTVTASVNGERCSFPAQTTLLDVVRSLHLEPERVAIELNRMIVKREQWTATTIAGGAEIEIVQFVGGG